MVRHIAKAYPDAARFVTDFKNRFGKTPQPFAAQAYECTALLLKGIETAAQGGSGQRPARAGVVKAVRALKDFKGITGNINLNAKGDVAKSTYFIIQVSAADPSKWSDNNIHQTMEILAPVSMP